jgi:ATP-dependent RNA helicase RhlE
VVKQLARAGIAANAIHGNKSQNHRERTLAAFRSGEVRTLVATDIAARGIDVDGISVVVNFDLPNVPETYVHRIGRTARAGAEGTAISLVAGAEELSWLRDIERLIRLQLPREDRRSGRHDAAAAPTQQHHRGGRPAPRPHAGRPQGHPHGRAQERSQDRSHDRAQDRSHDRSQARPKARPHNGASAPKGPRRNRRGGGNKGAPQINRQEPHRSPQGGGKAEGLQGVAFLHRESRPNRNQQPN